MIAMDSQIHTAILFTAVHTHTKKKLLRIKLFFFLFSLVLHQHFEEIYILDLVCGKCHILSHRFIDKNLCIYTKYPPRFIAVIVNSLLVKQVK